MTNPLGHDINGKPIYVGSAVEVVFTIPAMRKHMGAKDVVIGRGPCGDLECIAFYAYASSLKVIDPFDPLSEDTQEERGLEHA